MSVVEDADGDVRLQDLAGFSRVAPGLSLCMMVFVLSLAGIPPLAGFMGKFFVFAAAVQLEAQNWGLLWLVILAILMSAVSLYYYLQILKQIYVMPESRPNRSVRFSRPFGLAVVVAAAAVLLLGCLPGLLVGRLAAAVIALGW